MGLCNDQWTPSAEKFYLDRIDSFRRKEWKLRTATKWKESYRFDRLFMDFLYVGSERLALEFLERELRRIGM